MNKSITSFWNEYDLILAPMIEGGHQDDDSVTAALLKSKDRVKQISKLLLYPTYRGLKKIPWLYRCGIPKNIFVDKKNYFTMPNKWIFYMLKTYFNAYMSQSSTWILLLPQLLFALLMGELNSIADNRRNLNNFSSLCNLYLIICFYLDFLFYS